jgi:hypothetical protein
MLHRAGLIELAQAAGREKPYRLVAKHLKVGSEIRAAGLATELQAAQLRELQRGFEVHGADGEFRPRRYTRAWSSRRCAGCSNELIDKINELEDESQPTYTITIAFHPLIREGETD